MGFCTPDKKIVIDCVFDDAEQFQDDLAVVKKNGKYGLINKYGKEIIPYKYDYIWSFDEGLAKVKDDNLCGFMDRHGN